MKIAMIGTRGVPAAYGGFETAIQEIGQRLAQDGHEVVVYCRNHDNPQKTYLGMRLVNLPAIKTKRLETLSHSGLSVLHAVMVGHPDVAIVFNSGNAPWLPLLKAARIPFAVHVDGLEWKRSKWQGWSAKYYKSAERASVRLADALISDAHGIEEYILGEYGKSSYMIPYGAPLVDPDPTVLSEKSIVPGAYRLVVARFEPENHVLEIVKGFHESNSRDPLVVVGSAPYSSNYTDQIETVAAQDSRIRLLGGIWDQTLLDGLYANCTAYIHGHSVGGTNPSLLRAMGAAASVIAFDCSFNREVAGEDALYFSSLHELSCILNNEDMDPHQATIRGKLGRERVGRLYRWDEVAEQYGQLCSDLKMMHESVEVSSIEVSN